MLTARPILCPVDFSEPSRRALVWASTIARHRGGGLVVLFVGEPLLTQAASIRLGVDLTQAENRPALRSFVEATLPADARQRTAIQLIATVGEPVEVILRTARRRKAGLIVMGTHGRGGLRRFLLGSTTEEVLRLTSCPTLAVPSDAGGSPTEPLERVGVKRILLATDFGESATAAARWAADLASDLDTRLVVAHVLEPVVVPRRWQMLAADSEDNRAAAARERLSRLAANVPGARTTWALSAGAPANAIAALAMEHGADLVVLGGAAGTPDAHPPGAIAYRLLQLAHIPLLVVPARSGRPYVNRSPGRSASIDDECDKTHSERRRVETV